MSEDDRCPVEVRRGKQTSRRWGVGGQLVTERRVHLEREHAIKSLFGRRGPGGKRGTVDIKVPGDGGVTLRFVAAQQPDATDLKVLLAILDLVAERHAIVPCAGDGGFADPGEPTRATRATLGEVARRAGLGERLGGDGYARLAERLDRLARVSVTVDTPEFHGTTALLTWGGRKRGARLTADSATSFAPWSMLAKAATGEGGSYVLVPLADVAGLGELETLLLVAIRARVWGSEEKNPDLDTVCAWVEPRWDEPEWNKLNPGGKREVRRRVLAALKNLAGKSFSGLSIEIEQGAEARGRRAAAVRVIIDRSTKREDGPALTKILAGWRERRQGEGGGEDEAVV